MKRRLVSSLLALQLALVTPVQASDIVVIAGHAPASITAAMKTAAVYLTLKNTGTNDSVVVGIATEAAMMAHVHETQMVDGVAQMRMQERLVLAAGTEFHMQQGQVHIMLMGLKDPLKAGDMLKLTLAFETGETLSVEVPVTPLR